LQPNIALK